MAQAKTRNEYTTRSEQPSAAVKAAEQRAAAAEQQVQELEQRIETLENQQPTMSSEPALSVPSSPATRSEAIELEGVAALRQEPMMDHLLNALADGQDVGHYGRLVFAMVAHHFLSEDELVAWLTKDRDFSPADASTLLRQVESRDYNPPRRERILEWQNQQQFPILPNPEDPDCGNVYRNLKFPPSVYEHIQEYEEEKVQAQNPASVAGASQSSATE